MFSTSTAMRVLILGFLCSLLYSYANAKVYGTLEQAERRCIQKSSLIKTTQYNWQCNLIKKGQKQKFHFVHFDKARVHCIKQAKSGLGFVCNAVKPVGVEPLIRDTSDLNLNLE